MTIYWSSRTTSPTSKTPWRPSFGRLFPPAGEVQRRQHLSEARSTEKSHGRRIQRHLQASDRLAGHLDWPGLAQVCRLERTSVRNGRTTVEVQYAITSVSPQRADATLLLKHWRGHWGIENRLHWVRDVTFGEDKCQVKKGHGPQNLAAFRNAAITLLRLSGFPQIAPTLRRFAHQPRQLLRFLGIMKN